MTLRILQSWFFLAVSLVGLSSSIAASSFKPEVLLREPNTQLVMAVFCEPTADLCLKSSQEWKHIEKNYGDLGLRLVVIYTGTLSQSSDSLWKGYDKVWDKGGHISKRYGVGPKGGVYLWDWKNHLLLDGGDLLAVERALRNYVNMEWRLSVESAKNTWRNVPATRFVLQEFKRQTKFEIVLSATERKINSKRKREFSRRNFKRRAELGHEVSANTRAVISIEQGSLVLNVSSINEAKLLYSGSQRLGKKGSEAAARLLVSDVMRLFGRSELQLPETSSSFTDRSSGIVQKGVRPFEDNNGAEVESNKLRDHGFLIIKTVPAKADLYLNDRFIGKSPKQLKRETGRYNIKASYGARYHPAAQDIILGVEGTTIELRLKQAYARVRFDTSPGGARVFLEGERLGTTPFEVDKLPGIYSYRLAKNAYISKTGKILVESPRTQRISHRFEPNAGSLLVDSVPKGASIILDGVLTGYKTPHQWKMIEPGVRQIELSLPGYGSFKKPLEVQRNKESALSAKLVPRYGEVAISALQSGGAICEGPFFLDGNIKASGTAPTILRLVAKDYSIVVRCSGMSAFGDFSVKHNESVEVKLTVKAKSKAQVISKKNPRLKKQLRQPKKFSEISVRRESVEKKSGTGVVIVEFPKLNAKEVNKDSEAELNLKMRQFEKVIPLVKKEGESLPVARIELAETYSLKALVFEQEKKTSKADRYRGLAIGEYEKVLDDYPQRPNQDVLHWRIAGLYYDLGEFEEAEEHLKEVLDNFEKSEVRGEAALLLGELMSRHKRRDLKVMGKLYRIAANSLIPKIRALGAYRLGLWLYERGDYVGAGASLNRSLAAAKECEEDLPSGFYMDVNSDLFNKVLPKMPQ
jgi:hypothetical protein